MISQVCIDNNYCLSACRDNFGWNRNRKKKCVESTTTVFVFVKMYQYMHDYFLFYLAATEH